MKKSNYLQPLWMFALLMAVSVSFVSCAVIDSPVDPKKDPEPNNWSSCLKVSDVLFQTTAAFGQDYQLRPFGQDSLLTGAESLVFTITSDETTFKLRQTLEIPENTLAKVTMTDKYGEAQGGTEYDFKSVFKKSKMGSKLKTTSNLAFEMKRGGEYECLLDIEVLNFKKSQAVVIYSAPGFYISGLDSIVGGKDVKLDVDCNTGYPYDYNSLLGNEYAKVTVYKVNSDNTETEILTNEIELPFKQAGKPLIAQIATLSITMGKPDPGTYRLHFESNWKGLKERNTTIKIKESSETDTNSN